MLRRTIRSWGARVAVEGDSMRPTLEPGDWLLTDPDAFAHTLPVVGDLVLVPDPRMPERLLVKRVAEAEGAELFVAGDAAAASTDSRTFGRVSAGRLEGRPWFRYWPLRRLGRIQ